MSTDNIYRASIDCQVESNINDPEPLNIFQLNSEFLSDCTDFVININNIKYSPWINDSIVRWAKVDRKISLSPIQESIIRFLQRQYFRKNQPCFSKQTYIAEKLNVHRTQVNRGLAALEKKGLIVRIVWLYKGRRKNSIILPLLPSIKHLFNTETCTLQEDFQGCYIKCDNLFCKPLESKGFPKSFLLYTNILYINRISNNNLVTIDSILVYKYKAKANVVSDEPTSATPTLVYSKAPDSDSDKEYIDLDKTKKPLDKACRVQVLQKEEIRVPVDSLKGGNRPMLQRFLLKREECRNKPHAYQYLFDQLKVRSKYEFDDLDTGDQTELNTYIDFFHGIDVRKHFKISRHQKNGYYNNHAKEIRKQLMWLIANKHELQWDYADKVIEHWNKADIADKRFQRLRLNKKETKAYKNAVITISHCLIHCAGSRINALFEAIDRLEVTQHKMKPPFTWNSNITIEKFFSKLSDQYLKIYLSSDIEFERYANKRRIAKRHMQRVDTAYDHFSNLFIEQFYANNEQKGQDLCYRFEPRIKKWLEERISEIVDLNSSKSSYRNMEGYSLVENRQDNTGCVIPPLLQRYFYYIHSNIGAYSTMSDNNMFDGSMPKMIDITSKEMWSDFIKTHMRIEVGLKDFYKIIKRDNI